VSVSVGVGVSVSVGVFEGVFEGVGVLECGRLGVRLRSGERGRG